jgi:hypothetical protein
MKHLPGHLYCLEYRIKLTLALYGYCYSIYHHSGEPEWSWSRYLLGNLNNLPNPIISFSDYSDALAYLEKYPQLDLYIRRERYVP